LSVWYRVTLEILPPFITRQSGALPFGLDADMCRAPDGVPAIPGSLIKGNLLEVFERIGRKDLIDGWLGEEKPLVVGGEAFTEPTKLVFDPFWKLQGDGKTQGLRTRIRIDEKTGATGDKMLQISRVLDSEEKQAEGEHPLIFSGWIHVQTDKPLSELRGWIEKGLKLIPALGGDRGVGLGRLHSAKVEEAGTFEAPALLRGKSTRLSGEAKQQIIDKRSLGLCIHPLWPFCFPRHRPVKSNAIVSRDWIPGSAIKAVLAGAIKRKHGSLGEVQNIFDGMRVTHARPVLKDQRERPAAVPLSLAAIKDECGGYGLYDLTTKDKPGLIDGKVPAFQPDWKRKVFDLAHGYMGWPKPPPRILQVRNAHDLDSRAAKNQQLYTVESVLVHQGYDWLANIDFPDSNEGQLEQLLDYFSDLLEQQDCYPLGRTKTPVALEIDSCGFRFKHGEGPLTEGEPLIITLQSPARLLFSEGLEDIRTTDGAEALHDAYQQAFNELAKDAHVLKLKHYFAQQELRGGNFWYKKYGAKTLDGYQAQVFTRAGSVFVFDVKDSEKAEEQIDKWRRLGLPQLGDAPGKKDSKIKNLKREPWKRNPWVGENGYGEITVNQQLRQPGETEWKNV